MTQCTEELPSARRSITLPPRLARHRVELARWALQHGQSVDLDAATIILLAAEPVPTRRTSFRWTRQQVAELLWTGAAEVCRLHGVELPAGTSETLWTVLCHLDATGGLEGDPLPLLKEELAVSAGLDRRGRLRHPSGGVRRSAEVRPLRRRPA
jgi:hypothetical protein